MLASKQTEFIEWAAIGALLSTVCVLPWLLGGAIPAGKLWLVAGGCLTLVFVLAAAALQKKRLLLPPGGVWLLAGLSGIGMLHLLPIFPVATAGMNHAVVFSGSPQRSDFEEAGVVGQQSSSSRNAGRSLSHSSTRSHIAQWLGLSLLFCATFDLVRTRRRLIFVFVVSTANGVALAVVGLLQFFAGGKMIVGEEWRRNVSSAAFGPFVNPNNAAGWLCVHLGISLGLLAFVWFPQLPISMARSKKSVTWQMRFHDCWDAVLSRTSTLTPFHCLSVFAVVLVMAAIAASLSRGGILAGVMGLMIWGLSQFRGLRGTSALVGIGFLVLVLSGFLILFDLDTLVAAELMTLKDPVSQSTARFLHWSDSLAIVRDFPLIGAGQGTYAFCTLPYQRRWVQSWFVNADNQYVEIIVESGLLGLILFVAFGAFVVRDSIRLLRAQGACGEQGSLSISHLRVLGATGLGVIVSQGMAMFLDFGIGLSSTAAALVMVSAAIAAAASPVSRMRRLDGDRQGRLSGSIVGASVRGCLVLSACVYLPDLAASHNIYASVIQTERALKAPITREQLLDLPGIEVQIRHLLKSRPDDSDALRALVYLVEARARLALVDSLAEVPVRNAELQKAWDSLSPVGLADRMIVLRSEGRSEMWARIRQESENASAGHSWHLDLQVLQLAAPLMPGTRGMRMASKFALSGEAPSEESLQDLLFAEPANARSLFFAGKFCFAAGYREWAVQCWSRANGVSEFFRGAILSIAWTQWAQDVCINELAPRRFQDTVSVAEQVTDPGLKDALWGLADKQWALLSMTSLTEREQVQRARQLRVVSGSDAALHWVDHCLLDLPRTIELRRMRAELLEESGQFEEALGEWFRIQHYHPHDSSAAASIRRLAGP